MFPEPTVEFDIFRQLELGKDINKQETFVSFFAKLWLYMEPLSAICSNRRGYAVNGEVYRSNMG